MIIPLLGITALLGRLHPLLVHLPIGILLLSALFVFLPGAKNKSVLQQATRLALLAGTLTGLASCISGYLLSTSGSYDASLVAKHQWLGIGTTATAGLTYSLHCKNHPAVKWITGFLCFILLLTGHFGGSLTHGSGYLTEALTTNKTNNTQRKPLANVQEAVAYTEIIRPILQEKCYSCHGASKQKGKLRLDEPGFIEKGGEDGSVISKGKPDESELVKRLLLPKEHKEHMPPKEKPQLSTAETALIQWWISAGCDFTKRTKELAQTEKIKPVLVSLQNTGAVKEETATAELPAQPVEPADRTVLNQLKERGVAVTAIASSSNYLEANCVAVDSLRNEDLQLILQLKKQLISLKLGHTRTDDGMMVYVAQLTTLNRLYLENTKVTDKGIALLKPLTMLRYLNLSGTAVTAEGLKNLQPLQELKQLYLFHTGISSATFPGLRKLFPAARIDTGGYLVPFLAGDTQELKEPTKK